MDDTTKQILQQLYEITRTKKEIENEEAELRSQLERRLNSFHAEAEKIEVQGMATITRVPEKVSRTFNSKDVLTFAKALKAAGSPIGDDLLLLEKESSRKAYIRIDWEV